MEGLPVAVLPSEQADARGRCSVSAGMAAVGSGTCAICLERILIQETALVNGCEHAYWLCCCGDVCSVTCILRWATYNQKPSCPQCKHPFESLNVHRALDGCIHDYMFKESVCLLLRASWFEPLTVEAQEDPHEDISHTYAEYDELGDELEEAYYMSSSPALRIGNRRWGDNGYVRTGRKEARPVSGQFPDDSGAGPSRGAKKKEVSGDVKGRRAKRTLKREAADKAAAEKHQQRLQSLGLK